MPHLRRARFSPRHPLHVTLRVRRGVYNLRSRRFFKIFEHALRVECARPIAGESDVFRVVHYAVLGNHMHLVVEAPDQVTLSRRMQGLEIRLAKNFNRVMKRRRGPVFADRYHARALKTPLEVRRVLHYVMGNASRHYYGSTSDVCAPDVFSSAEFFDGWQGGVQVPHSLCSPGPPPVSPPRTWLLRAGWKRYGLLATRAE